MPVNLAIDRRRLVYQVETGAEIHISRPELGSTVSLCGKQAERLVSPAFASILDRETLCAKCLELLRHQSGL